MTEPVDNEQWRLASFAGTYCLIEHGVQLLADNLFTDDELPAIKQFSPDRQMRLAARLIDLGEQLRKVQQVLDFDVMVLTGEVDVEGAPD